MTWRRLAVAAVATSVLGTATPVTTVEAGWFTRACAARDLQILMMIEERESENTLSPAEVSEALSGMLDARLICHIGRIGEALSRYDSIGQSIVSDRPRVKANPPGRWVPELPPQP